MEKIDAAWIKARLTGEHGEKARLAVALGISDDKVSKILSGQRLVKASEVSTLLSFFGESLAVSGKRQALLDRFDRLSQQGQEQAELLVDALLAREAAMKADRG